MRSPIVVLSTDIFSCGDWFERRHSTDAFRSTLDEMDGSAVAEKARDAIQFRNSVTQKATSGDSNSFLNFFLLLPSFVL